ncbi:metallophosphoesterase family protein [Streptomyces sp. NPDC005423]|uniref:metallophosphoesterase family protein n=1 Tax=Streptomyces sp. NPDC005423 TaxID=3155343 RepID=UPI0033AB045C
MVASIAVLSDIHGVLPALQAVLDEPDVRAADLIVVTGDHVAGPQPVEVLDRLRALGDQAVLVRGNADRELVDMARGEFPSDQAWEIDLWAAAQLGDEHVRFLAELPHPVTMEVDGFGKVVFCHGTPRDDDEVVLVDTHLDRWAEVFAELPADVRTVVCGHTHMPFTRYVDERLVVNSGSIGMPYGQAGGSWALLQDGQVQLRHTRFDIDGAVDRVARESGYLGRRAWAEHYVRAVTTDAEAVRAFGPRDGRTIS